MILNTTLKSIRVVLAEATVTNECDITASWGDYAQTQFLPGSADGATSGATPVTIVGAPGLNEQRVVQEITVYNRDTVTHTISLQLLNNATVRVFRHQEIPVGGMLIYSPNGGEDAVNTEPAVLLETGTVGAKISVLPVLAAELVGPELLPIAASGTTQALTANWLYWNLFTADGLSPFPLDATAGVAAAGVVIGGGRGNAAHPVPGGVQFGAGNAGTGGNNDGGIANIFSGDGDGTGNGGPLLLSGGASGSGATGDGGAITLTAGHSSATAGTGGAVNILSGTGPTGSGLVYVQSVDNATGFTGDAYIFSGNSTVTGNSGAAGVGTGDATVGTTGETDIYTGTSASGASGPVHVLTGDANGTDAGIISMTGGKVASGNGTGGSFYFSGGDGGGTGAGGLVQITSGNSGAGATGNGGVITFESGHSVATDGDGGDITLTTGAGNGTGRRGNIVFATDLITAPAAAGIVMQSDGNLNVGTNNTTGASPSSTSALYSGDTVSGTSGQVLVYSGVSSGGDTGLVYVQSSNASGSSGDAFIFSGDSTVSGNSGATGVGSGNVTLGFSGPVDVYTGGSASGDTGFANMATGDAAAGTSGNVNLSTGAADGGGHSSGSIALVVGAATTGATKGTIQFAGDVRLTDGNGQIYSELAIGIDMECVDGTSGTIYLQAGNAAAVANGGVIFLQSGNGGATSGDGGLFGAAAGAATVGNGGDAQLIAGNTAAGNGGSVLVQAGDGAGGGSLGGNITLHPGGGATKGLFIVDNLPTSAPATSGAVWRDAGAGNVLKCVP